MMFITGTIFTFSIICTLLVILAILLALTIKKQRQINYLNIANAKKEIDEISDALKRERAFASKIVNSIKSAILLTDSNGKILYANSISEKLAGQDFQSLAGTHSDQFFAKFKQEDGKNAENLNLKVSKSVKKVLDFTQRIQCPDGHFEIFSLYCSPIEIDSQKKSGAVLIATRITESVKIREELTNTNAILRRIFQESSCGISIKDVDKGCRYLFWNKEMEILTGKSEKDMIGKTYRECFKNEQSEFIENEDEKTLKFGHSISDIIKIKSHSDGKFRYFSQKKSLIELPDGSKMILTICADYSDIINNQREKNEILESMSEGIVLFENNRRILYANKAARDIARIDESALGNTYCDGVFCKESHMHDCANVQTVKTGQKLSVVKKINGKLYNVVSSAIKDDEGKVAKALMILTDITKEEQAKYELSQALKKSNAAIEAKSAFLSTMSHEIRTPLNVIIGSAELLNLEKLSENAMDSVKAIYVASSALSQIINNVLDYSKLDAGRMEIILRATRISGIMSDMKRLFNQKAEDKKIQLICASENIPTLMIDNQHIRQILMNLISNALKFTDAGTVKISAVFEPLNNFKGNLKITVSDTGRGIEKQNIRTMFLPFEREITHNSRRIEGTGLGLSISLLLAKLMGGSIDISSQVGVGSSFTLSIPNIEIVQSKNEILPDLETGIADFSGRKVLVVDDIAMNRTVLSKILQKLNIETREASNVDEALKLIKSECFDSVITDLWMPEKSGADLAEELANDTLLKDIPLILLTADTEMKDNYNVDRFKGLILKPITIKNVSRALLQVLK